MTTLTQTQSEALVKLLLVARYQDKKLSLLEEDAFNQRLVNLPWKSATAIDTYASRELATVRKVVDTAETTQAFVTTQLAAFDADEAKTTCLQALENVLAADGIEAAENQFLQQVKTVLGV